MLCTRVRLLAWTMSALRSRCSEALSRPLQNEESLEDMTERNKRYLPIAAIAAVALVAAACSSGSDDAAPSSSTPVASGEPAGTALAFAAVMGGTNIAPGTYHLTGVSDAFQTALEAHDGPTGGYMTGDTETIGGIVLTCFLGPCSVTVARDGSHFTTTGTIHTADYTPPPIDEEPEEEETGETEAEIAAKVKLLLASIGPGGVKANATPEETPNDVDSDNTLPVTITGGELTDSTPKDATDDFTVRNSGDWIYGGVENFWAYQDRTTEDDAVPAVRESILSYTTQEDAEDAAYTVYYAENTARPGVTGATVEGVLNLNYSDLGVFLPLISVPDFPSVRDQDFMFVDDETTLDVKENEVSGMFNGIPGTFTCDQSCNVGTDGEGVIDAISGTWTFTPTEAVAKIIIVDAIPDPDYMDWGYWVERTTDADGETKVRVLAYAHSPLANNYGPVTPLEGSAEYAGQAVGQYVKQAFDPATGAAIGVGYGHFGAWAELTAYFGGGDVAVNDEDRVEGTVSYFKDEDDNIIDPTWMLNLVKGASSTDGTFSGTTMADTDGDKMADGAMGEFEGTFHGDSTEVMVNGESVKPMPSSASGTFDGHFRNGHVYGAFGASLVE